jgi:hypothetical protein
MADQNPKPKAHFVWAELLPLVAGIVTTIAVAGTFYSYKTTIEKPAFVNLTAKDLDELHLQITRLDADVTSVQGQLKALSNVPEDSKVAIQLKAIDTTLADLKTRHGKLEDVILNNPIKAIEVPLLRKDLDNLKDSQQQNLLALKQGVDQVYDLNKWLLGAMAVSILTLAISNFLKGKEKDKPTSG